MSRKSRHCGLRAGKKDAVAPSRQAEQTILDAFESQLKIRTAEAPVEEPNHFEAMARNKPP